LFRLATATYRIKLRTISSVIKLEDILQFSEKHRRKRERQWKPRTWNAIIPFQETLFEHEASGFAFRTEEEPKQFRKMKS